MSRTLLCPMCLNEIDWAAAPLYERVDGQYVPMSRQPGDGDIAWRSRLGRAARACEATGADSRHFLPYRYGEGDVPPIVVGVVGDTGMGKSHLLAAMIRRLDEPDRLARHDLQVQPLDLDIHERYLGTVVRPMIDDRRQLPATPRAANVEFADAVEIRRISTGRSAVVAFFDVAGEMLAGAQEGMEFIPAVGALLFVVDPTRVEGIARVCGGDLATAGRTGDRTFGATLNRLTEHRAGTPRARLPIPSAIVVAKADWLELRASWPRIDDWLAYHEDEEFDLTTVAAESEDVYALLRTTGGDQWLRPFHACAPCSLHLASATGCDPGEDGVFPAAQFRQRRVLKPLLTLLAYHGVVAAAPPLAQGRP